MIPFENLDITQPFLQPEDEVAPGEVDVLPSLLCIKDHGGAHVPVDDSWLRSVQQRLLNYLDGWKIENVPVGEADHDQEVRHGNILDSDVEVVTGGGLDEGETAGHLDVPDLHRVATPDVQELTLEGQTGDVVAAEDVLLEQPHPGPAAVDDQVPAGVAGGLLGVGGDDVVLAHVHQTEDGILQQTELEVGLDSPEASP